MNFIWLVYRKLAAPCQGHTLEGCGGATSPNNITVRPQSLCERGLRIHPWGTPIVVSFQPEHFPFKTVLCLQFIRKLLIRVSSDEGMPFCFNFYCRLSHRAVLHLTLLEEGGGGTARSKVYI